MATGCWRGRARAGLARRCPRGAAVLVGLAVACSDTAGAQDPGAIPEGQDNAIHVKTTEHSGPPPLPTADAIAQLAPDGGPDFNRLIFETSPYLRQHARNPVDWYAWGADAFAKARAEGKPIFLSVGYSSCHWCHVMAHESFEDPATAALMNEHFINIKVDREERPDVDDIYMKAVQAIAGRGGWPMSVFLLPDGRPYYGGTYFPREDGRHGAGFKTVLVALAKAYTERRDEVEEQAARLAGVVQQQVGGGALQTSGPLSRDLIGQAIAALQEQFDRTRGGFGGAPKFPPHMSLDLLLYEYERTGREELAAPITVTLDAMLRGGVYDHVGGGFHRYSTDAVWLVPHFEKMLYDNGQLARAYSTAYRLFGEARYRAVAEGICDWAIREMRAEGGGFYSALDADSEGEEGKFYVWTHAEVLDVLGEEEGNLFCRVYGIRPQGNFREEATGKQLPANIPHRTEPLAETAAALKLEPAHLEARLAAARAKLRAVRDARVWPGLDDKVLTSWNGLMIGGLATAGKTFERQDYLEAAAGAAEFLLTTMRVDGRLLRSYNHGQAKLNAYLDDYAFLSLGLLDLYDATGEERWLTEARALMDVLFDHYGDETGGGFYFTSDDHEDLLARKKDCIDGAIPSGNGVAARVLIRLAHLTGEQRYTDAVLQAFDVYLGWMQRAPRATESMIVAVAEAYDRGLAAPAPVTAAATPPDATWRSDQVAAHAYASRVVLSPGLTFDVAVQLQIAEGWHVNSHAPHQDYLVPTSLALTDGVVLTAGDATYPAGRDLTLAFSPEPLSVYDGTVLLGLAVTLAADAKAGPATVELTLQVQACDDRQCLRPATATLRIPVTVVATSAAEETRHPGIFGAL